MPKGSAAAKPKLTTTASAASVALELYALLVEAPDGSKGIVSIGLPNGASANVTAFNPEEVIGMRESARHIASMVDRPVTVARFVLEEELESYQPLAVVRQPAPTLLGANGRPLTRPGHA